MVWVKPFIVIEQSFFLISKKLADISVLYSLILTIEVKVYLRNRS
jgi:hypothetical protein